jgi:hypothetical protein
MRTFLTQTFFAGLVFSLALPGCKQAPADVAATTEVAAGGAMSPDTLKKYLSAGQEFAKATGSVLVKNLTEAINARGPEGAIEFCSVRAHPLTDSIARALGADIRRVTDRPRNPANQADATALAHIETLQGNMAAGNPPSGMIMEVNGQRVGYYPIVTNAMCMVCHGQPGTDIAPATQSRLAALYPADKATGYRPDELRGLWVVTFGDAPSPGEGE